MFSASVADLIREDVALAPHCWLGIGGSAQYFAEAPDQVTLETLCAEAHQAGLSVRVLGGGSNLLIRPGRVEALVIKLIGEFGGISTQGSILRAGSAADLGDVIASAAESGLAGLEHFAGIPGTVGGAIVSNSGVTNDDIGSKVRLVRVVTREGNSQELTRKALRFGFRRSNLEDAIVTEVEFELEQLDTETVTRRLQANWIVRKAAQPAVGVRTAQVFIEPSGYGISELLDAAGMRSAAEGEAAMDSRFPGFVVVNDNATANDVLALANRISRAVEVQSGIQLKPQLKIW